MAESDSSIFSSIGSGMHDLNDLIFVKNKKITSWVSVFLVIGLTYLVFNAEANTDMLGRAEILSIIGSGGENGLPPGVEDYLEIGTTRNVPGELEEGDSMEITVENTGERILSNISYSLTWTDENDPPGRPRVRRYDNQPDQFSVVIMTPEGNSTVLAPSSGGGGSLRGSHNFKEEEIGGIYNQGNLTVVVTLTNAGDWEPNFGIGIMDLPDTGNSFELVLEMEHLQPERDE